MHWLLSVCLCVLTPNKPSGLRPCTRWDLLRDWISVIARKFGGVCLSAGDLRSMIFHLRSHELDRASRGDRIPPSAIAIADKPALQQHSADSRGEARDRAHQDLRRSASAAMTAAGSRTPESFMSPPPPPGCQVSNYAPQSRFTGVSVVSGTARHPSSAISADAAKSRIYPLSAVASSAVISRSSPAPFGPRAEESSAPQSAAKLADFGPPGASTQDGDEPLLHTASPSIPERLQEGQALGAAPQSGGATSSLEDDELDLDELPADVVERFAENNEALTKRMSREAMHISRRQEREADLVRKEEHEKSKAQETRSFLNYAVTSNKAMRTGPIRPR